MRCQLRNCVRVLDRKHITMQCFGAVISCTTTKSGIIPTVSRSKSTTRFVGRTTAAMDHPLMLKWSTAVS
ncbi:hypothetical protein DPMN_117798 [Dreissena polymorpha]|uniref:Uncharacterized protein n=1 Tax=Dreissena polymorpha TaxID=45954 RepID=A0A9D4GJN5_DREPO|nr:hypothetical protein DPMN_117798 [Dreissena polymorpha]